MQLIETYSDISIEVDGRTLPDTCLVEDEDGFRVLILPYAVMDRGDSQAMQVPARTWVGAGSAGARMLAIPVPGGEGMWWTISSEKFMDEREEHPFTRSFLIPIESVIGWDHLPTFRETLTKRLIAEAKAADAPEEPITGFVHLHTHSEFSPLDGMSTMPKIVREVVRHGQQAVSVNDHGTCAGHPNLQIEADKVGIKPIFGIEANLVDDRFRRGDPAIVGDGKKVLGDYSHLILWAEDNRGLQNIWAASTEANRDGFYARPRMDWKTLERCSEGVLASTGCLRGPVSRKILEGDEEGARAVLAKLMGIYPDRLWAEIHTNQLPEQLVVNRAIVALAREYDLPLVAVSDSHYPCAEDKMAHAVWIASQTNSDLSSDADLFSGDADYHILSEEEVRSSLAYLDPEVVEEAISNTAAIANRCTATLGGKTEPPIFSKAATVEEARERDVDRLIEICLSNWSKTMGDKRYDQEVYEARFEQEMKLLISKNFCGYYLMVSEYCIWARENGILVGPGRGSGSGSLVAFLSLITDLDPVEVGLMFERFLTPGRTSLPDFDVDFPASKRPQITNHVIERYGRENVVRVGTHIRLQSKGVVRDMARVLNGSREMMGQDVHYPDIDAVSKIIEMAEADKAGLGMPWEDLWAQYDEELSPYRQKYPVLFGYADDLVGLLKSYGKHPAGVVIAPNADLVNSFPMRLAGDDLVIEFDMDASEALGLVKFDLLTLRTLDTIQDTIDGIKATTGDVVDVYSWTEEYLDPLVWDEVSDGHTLGIFQIETPGGTRDTKRFQPHSLGELADVITLVRPGPKNSGLTEAYYRRMIGEEDVTFLDPRLEPVLSSTYGAMIYQEQVINTCKVLGGYTSEEADEIRRLLGKKKIEQVEAAGKKFVSRCIENGTDAEVARIIWEQMAEFAKYSFNLSHAYGYAVLGYWTAWLKFHYPVQFLTAVLSTVKKDRIPEFINEARRMGYRVLPPDINLSGRGFTSGQMEVRYGFDSVKGCGPAVVDGLLAGQPYASWDDFLERKGSKVNIGHIKTLAKVGTFDSLEPNRKMLETRLEWESNGDADRCTFKDETVIGPNGLPCTFDWSSEPVPLGKRGQPLKPKPLPKRCTKACRNWTAPTLEILSIEPYTDDEIMEKEMELLGVHLSSTPFDRIPQDVLDEIQVGHDVEEGGSGEYVIPALVTRVRPHTARNGKDMAFIGLNAIDAELDVTVFSSQWETHQFDLKRGALCLAVIFKNERGITLSALQPL